MKAQEYFEKYFEHAENYDQMVEGGKNMFCDMCGEYQIIEKTRKVKSMGAAVGIVRELNTKWNSVASKVEKKFSARVMKRNVIWNELLSKHWGDIYPRKPD